MSDDVDVDEMYRIACGLPQKGGWGIQPSEFWNMSPYEWWRLYEINIGADIRDREDTRARLKRIWKALSDD